MILRRIAHHVREQNWTAIGIDFVIVVVGVFLGIQLGNWNAARAERDRERLLLSELRTELAESVRQLQIKQRAFQQVGRAGERAIAFLDAGVDCGDDCWPVLVAFFHASQWQQVVVPRSTFDEMRRNGWPRDRDLLDALEDYLRQADQLTLPLERPPAYRTLVRGLIPLAAHRPYWTTCFELTNGEEVYLDDCPAGVAPEVTAAAVAAIRADPDLHRTLTEWAGFVGVFDVPLEGLITAAERALALTDAELGAANASPR